MKKIGLIGYGTIGRYLCEKMLNENNIEVEFIFDPFVNENEVPYKITNKFPENINGIDLIVEVANSDAVIEYGLKILKKTHFMPFSTTAFSDEIFFRKAIKISMENKTNIYIPHGAVLGLDGINDGKNIIEDVSITTIKKPINLGRKDKKRSIIYDGDTKGACKSFPRNVNVHGSIALAGIGFAKTKSKIIADPYIDGNTHIISIKGEGIEFDIKVKSIPKSLVSGAYTLESAFGSVKKVLSSYGGIKIV